jgi:hypothetical protein
MHRAAIVGVVFVALGQLDAARGEERCHAASAGLAVDVLEVVVLAEGLEVFAGSRFALVEELVEEVAPRSEVNSRGVGHHAVEIEDDRSMPVGGDEDGGHDATRVARAGRRHADAGLNARATG